MSPNLSLCLFISNYVKLQMGNNEIKFTGPRDLTNYLNGAQDLIQNLPQLSAIVRTSNLISVGCACNKRQKKDTPAPTASPRH